jgi:acyl-CoA reductase-like NAD-dependent aldehyde dehydrogenase
MLEAFGPVVLRAVRLLRRRVALANGSWFGLQAGVFARDLGRVRQACRDLEVGGVIVDDYPTFRVGNLPYGGAQDSGARARGRVRHAMED